MQYQGVGKDGKIGRIKKSEAKLKYILDAS
jgi:hypothetical protein